MNYYDFLERLFTNKPDNSNILIHQLPLQRSNFYKDYKKASQFIDTIVNGPQNIYTTGGLLRQGITTGRGKKTDIIGIVAMWADIDIKTKDKPRGVDTIEDAVALVVGHGCDPTIIIDTGNGIHCWWIFKEPLMFKDDKERQKQELRCKRLQETIRQRAKKSDWDIDSTFEVNRVLRLPGTYNRKDPANPLEVKLVLDTGIEYGNPENDFEEFIIPENQMTVRENLGGIIHVSSNLKLDPRAEPPADLFQDLVEIDPKFGQTFKGQRGEKDTKKWKDTSASAYVQSLSNYMAGAGWTDQEMADTIIAFYRENKSNTNIEGTPNLQKALRPDYIERTIGLARTSIAGKEVEKYFHNISPLIGTEFEKKLDPDGEKGRKTVNLALGGAIEIMSIIEHMAEKSATYVMEVKMPKVSYKTGQKIIKWIIIEISFDSTTLFYNLKPFEERIFERTQIALRIKPIYWKHVVCPNFKKFMVVKPVGEQTVESRMKFWMESYLENKDPKSREDASNDCSPFVFKGSWHIFADRFNSWAASTGKDQFEVVKSEKDFSAINAERVRYEVKPTYAKKRKSIRPWKIPPNIIPPPLMTITPNKEKDIESPTEHKDIINTKINTGN